MTDEQDDTDEVDTFLTGALFQTACQTKWWCRLSRERGLAPEPHARIVAGAGRLVVKVANGAACGGHGREAAAHLEHDRRPGNLAGKRFRAAFWLVSLPGAQLASRRPVRRSGQTFGKLDASVASGAVDLFLRNRGISEVGAGEDSIG